MTDDDDDIDNIYSPLERSISAEGHTLQICIYRGPDEPWILEIEDELGTSTVWSEQFETDHAALAAALATLEEEGVHEFVVQARQGAQETEAEMLRATALLRTLEAPEPQAPPTATPLLMQPLTEDELEELDGFLLHGVDSEEGMLLEMLDGFLHALAIGPEMVMPSRWLPKVWGLDSDMMPPMESEEQRNHILVLVMRHFNSIAAHFEQPAFTVPAIWSARAYEFLGYDDAEMWATGFCEGVKLSQAAWQPLLSSAEGQRWYRPLGLLGEKAFSADQDALTRTPAQRHALSGELADCVLHLHAHWLTLRQAVAQRQTAQRMCRKVGRNEACPCGSGKKFKKCCGAPAELH